MNETIKSILNRRSIRAFSNQEIDRDIVQTLLDCALAAPSGMNQQTWQFTAIVNQEKILNFARTVGKALGRDEGYNMYCPKLLIITSNEKESRFREVDNACAMENIYLGASSLGLGCVWINQVKDCYDNVEVRKLLTEFGIPESHGVYGCAAIGYPAGEPRDKTITAVAKIVE